MRQLRYGVENLGAQVPEYRRGMGCKEFKFFVLYRLIGMDSLLLNQ